MGVCLYNLGIGRTEAIPNWHGEVLITREAEEIKQVSCQMCGRKFRVTDVDLRCHGLKWKRLPSHPPKKS